MNKFVLTPIREENRLSVSMLAFIKGGATDGKITYCGEDNCVVNSGNCEVNNCHGNGADCGKNGCTTNSYSFVCGSNCNPNVCSKDAV